MITLIHVKASIAVQQAKKGQVSKCCGNEVLNKASTSRVDKELLQIDKKGRGTRHASTAFLCQGC